MWSYLGDGETIMRVSAKVALGFSSALLIRDQLAISRCYVSPYQFTAKTMKVRRLKRFHQCRDLADPSKSR